MKSYDFLTEGIVEDAHEMHQDHEVQMARKDCYQAAENAIALHKLLRHVSENQGIEGWVAAKITLASDYLNTVREYLEYELMNQHSEPMNMDTAPVTLALPVAESRQIDESKMKDLDLDLKKPPVGMTDQAFKKKYNMTKAEATSKFSAKKEVAEVAPPGAKAERMVKHIKKGYAKDGKLTPKEKSIAYATAWKAHNKGKVEEQGVAEAEKNPHTSALGKALYRDLSKEKKASPQQVQRNKERWAQRQADKEQGVAEGAELKQAKRKYNQAAKDANADQVGAGKKIDTMKKSLRQKDVAKQDMAESKKKSDTYHIVNKDGKPANLASYNDRASAEKDRDAKHQGAEVRQLGPRGKVKGVTEMSAGSVATVVNPTPKNKAKVGTLFGGTYQREEADTPSKKRMFNKKA
jgi:hypothetical protein